MADIFREVEEDVRKERLEQLWKRYGDYAIAVVAVILIVVAGYVLWQRYQASQRAKAAAEFTAVQRITNPAIAAGDFANLAKTAPGGYAELARLEQADALSAAGKNSEALDLYKKIAAGDDGLLGNLARLRAGWLAVETASKNDLETLLAPLTDPTSPWRQSAREVLAYGQFRNGDMKGAETEFEALANDSGSPDSLRQRARAMASFIKNGGEANYGSVPPETPPTPAAAAPSTP